MKKYRSHKIVEAAEVKSFEPPNEMYKTFEVVYVDGQKATFSGETNIFNRYAPMPGDFLMFYPDGYVSVSPRQQFLDGYTELGKEDDEPAAPAPVDEIELRKWCIGIANSVPNAGDDGVTKRAEQILEWVKKNV